MSENPQPSDAETERGPTEPLEQPRPSGECAGGTMTTPPSIADPSTHVQGVDRG